ncbi:MAG: hemerythrin domain-containing protein [Armatimonadota bacterium]|nr:hemerythrin domain-containing protein [Armatimonadota bacterium]
MKEHRRIERMVALIDREARRLANDGSAEPDTQFIRDAVPFMREYADQCHHGKEEDILFAALGERGISDEHQQILERLLDDHRRARELGASLLDATQRWEDGQEGARPQVVDALQSLAELYPEHIATEDQDFFIPVMDYLDEEEQREMMNDMWDFDRELFAARYEELLQQYEPESQAGQIRRSTNPCKDMRSRRTLRRW